MGRWRREAAGEPHIRREPSFLSVTVATEDDSSCTATLKRNDGALGFKVLIRNHFQRNRMIHACNLGMNFPVAWIKPHSTDYNRLCLKGHVHAVLL